MHPKFESMVAELAAAMTDPTNPDNQLKRPATRTCLYCLGWYKSQVSILCDDGFCSANCRRAAELLVEDYKAQNDFPQAKG